MEYDIIHELPYSNRKELIGVISCRYSICLWLTQLWKELESRKTETHEIKKSRLRNEEEKLNMTDGVIML